MIDISMDTHGVRADLERIPAALKTAAARAVTRTMQQARTQADRQITQTYFLSRAEVRKAVRFVPATQKRLVAQIVASSRTEARGGRLPLYSFDVRVTSSTQRIGLRYPSGLYSQQRTVDRIRVRVRRDRPATTLTHAFLATTRSGHRGIFERVYGSKYEGRARRPGKGWFKGGPPKRGGLPIVELYGPGVTTLYGAEAVYRVIDTYIAANYRRILTHEIAFVRGGRR